MGGIAIDTDGRALSKKTNSVIPGLYVVGEASGGVHGDNRLAGNSLLECTVFGRHVGLLLPIRESPSALPAAAAPFSAGATASVAAEETPKAGEALRKITAEELAAHKA